VALFLGIDGGGTKTTCAVGDDTSLLATATSGASNIIRVGEGPARSALDGAIRQAARAAGVEPREIRRTCIGTAGGARAQIAEKVRQIVAELVPGEIQVVGDTVIALQAAFNGGPGVVVIAGTGSIAYGKNARGQTARAGGWGFAICDEGSGHWIGRSAVTATLHAHDEGRSSTLFQVITKAWGVEGLDELVRVANATPPPDFSSLLPHILAAADTGDALPRSVLTQAGSELAGIAKIVIGRLFPRQPNVPVAMSGGVFRNSALVRQVFYNSLRSEFPSAKVESGVVDPVKGALDLARQGA
jgi:N-acetylglucosamine kinase-like BadF-type ATPase